MKPHSQTHSRFNFPLNPVASRLAVHNSHIYCILIDDVLWLKVSHAIGWKDLCNSTPHENPPIPSHHAFRDCPLHDTTWQETYCAPSIYIYREIKKSNHHIAEGLFICCTVSWMSLFLWLYIWGSSDETKRLRRSRSALRPMTERRRGSQDTHTHSSADAQLHILTCWVSCLVNHLHPDTSPQMTTHSLNDNQADDILLMSGV